jgi:hypothetical protein
MIDEGIRRADFFWERMQTQNPLHRERMSHPRFYGNIEKPPLAGSKAIFRGSRHVMNQRLSVV